MAETFDFTLPRFGGLCASTDASGELKDGESPDMCNFRVTPGGALRRRDGYRVLRRFEASLRGFWQGKLNGQDTVCAVAGNLLYAGADWDSIGEIGAVPGTEEVVFFPFGKKLYLLTGNGIYAYNGSAYSPLIPYVPLIMINTTPEGVGTPFEEMNSLTDEVRQEFDLSGGSALDFTLALDPVAILWVEIDGEQMDRNNFYWNVIRHCLTFRTPPASQGDGKMTVSYAVQGDPGVRSAILGCRHAVKFGGANDTRAFLYGSDSAPGMRYHTGLADGEPRMEYVPADGYTLVGDADPITAILRHYDRQLIFTNKAAYYSYLEYREGEGGKQYSVFPVLPLSDEYGCSAPGQATLMQNDPCTLSGADLCRWVSTNVRDERNAHVFSRAIAPLLKEEDPARAKIFNRRATGELYLAFPGRIYVYQYETGVFYRYETPEILGFSEAGGELYFITDHELCLAGGDTDGGEPIPAFWKSKFWDLGKPSVLKNLYTVRLTARRDGAEQIGVCFETDAGRGEELAFSGGGAVAGDTEVCLSHRVRPRRFRRIRLVITDRGERPCHLTAIGLTGLLTGKKA